MQFKIMKGNQSQSFPVLILDIKKLKNPKMADFHHL